MEMKLNDIKVTDYLCDQERKSLKTVFRSPFSVSWGLELLEFLCINTEECFVGGASLENHNCSHTKS